MAISAWGADQTQFFFKLTPDKVIQTAEKTGLLCTGRCSTYNSMENRVYEVEIDLESEVRAKLKSPSEAYRVLKFYRPGRWSREQILEEHQFLLDLKNIEVPVIYPLTFPDGSTLQQETDSGIWYALFPKLGGRSPEELNPEQLAIVGRLLARIHNCGASRPAPHRLRIGPETYGLAALQVLVDGKWLPEDIQKSFVHIVENICQLSTPWFAAAPAHRIHGDCHFGNLLWNQQGPFFLDFDDMVQGPAIQDLWMVVPGRDEYAREQFRHLITAYQQMRDFDFQTLRLIEPLRALRFVHFSAWMAKRWEDPAFPRAFPHFNTPLYWAELHSDLREQLALIAESALPVYGS